jgi:Uma2 family endonuclease
VLTQPSRGGVQPLLEDNPMNVSIAHRLTRAAEGLQRRRFTVADVEAMVEAGIMDEDERVELIGGELVPMSPRGSRHELVKSALNFRWCRVCPETYRVTQETMFRFSEDTCVEPDFVIYPLASGLMGLTQANVLLVVEIADSSRRYDTGRKAKVYASFGVRELWVIDAVKMTARTFRSPSESGYGGTSDYRATDQIVPLLAPAGFALRLDELRLA